MSETSESSKRNTMAEKSVSKPGKQVKLTAKKPIKISGPGCRVVIKKGDDCSKYSEKIKNKLKDNGVI